MIRRPLWLAPFFVVVACSPAAVPSAGAGARAPRFAAATDGPPPRARPADFTALAPRREPANAKARPAPGTRDPAVRRDDHGTPTFRWGSAPSGATASVRGTGADLSGRTAIVEQARAHLAASAPLYGLAASDLDQAEVMDVHDTGKGAIVVRFTRHVDGIEVFRGTTSIAMDRTGALVAQSGALAPASARPEGARFALDAAEAIGRALTDLTGDSYAAGDLVSAAPDQAGYVRFGLHPATAGTRGVRFWREARARRVWFPLPGGLEPAWYLEVGLERADERRALDYGYVISARDGALLFRHDQVRDAFTYRVFADPSGWPYDGPQGFAGTPHPTGVPDGFSPPFLPPNDVTLDNAGFGVPASDAWLAPGAVVTTGNNADAYIDANDTNVFDGGDVRPGVSAAGQFLYDFDHTTLTTGATNRRAAAVNLFYVNNFLHDWYYAAGFDEAHGNAQQSNYGRPGGGAEGDRIIAEGQDGSGLDPPNTDNANMSTPADGSSPRMQMYVWTAQTERSVTGNTPASIVQTVAAGMAQFGPQSFDLTGDVVVAQDAANSTGPLTTDACTTLTNASSVAGKIAFVDRGTCTFVVKIRNAQASGAIGVLIRTDDRAAGDMAGTDATLTIPSALVDRDFGTAVLNAVQAGGANVTLRRSAGQMRDGDLDTTIMAHEWAHYLTHRLIGNSSGLDTNQSNGLGEGWSDFHALLLVVRAEDADVPANAGWNGTYAEAAYSSGGKYRAGGNNDSFYWGIRRVPYSTDMTKNPLTFRHIAENEPIPTTAPGNVTIPVQFGEDGVGNSEVHATGEVWTTMLWECYAALLRDVPGRLTFAEAQDRMKRYMVTSYMLMPMSPTLLEARDAVLAAAWANDPTDFELLFDAFARRGAGIGAVGPNRYRSDNTPVVESYLTGPELAVGPALVAESATSNCSDGDGVLDDEETADVTVGLENVGSTTLAAATVTISSPDPRLTFPAGTTVPISATDPRGAASTAQVQFQVHLTGAYTAEIVPIDLAFPAGYLRDDAPRRLWLRVNYDDQAAVSSTDRFESATLAWATESIGTPDAFALQAVDAGQHEAAGPDVGVAAELRFTSPLLQVGTDPLVVTWRHRHAFETFDATLSTGTTVTVHGDGGIVELSQDGGTNWVDVGALALNSGISIYQGSLAYPTELGASQNPLRNKTSAVVDRNPSWPDFDLVTLDLGTTYSGKSVLFRFRIGTDEAGGGDPWEIDDFSASGITGTPFPGLVRDQNVCGSGGPVASAGADQRVLQGSAVTLDASASAAEDPAAVLTFLWSQVDDGSPLVTLGSTTSAVATFTAPDVTADTPLTFQVEVSAGGAPSTATTVVTVVPGNRRPVAVIAGGSSQVANEGAVVPLDGTGSTDQDAGTTLTYHWVRVSGPTITIAGANTATASFTAPQVSADTPLVVRLDVSDGTLTGSTTVTFTIKDLGNNSSGSGSSSGGGCGCGTASAAGPLAFAWLAALLRRRRLTPGAG